MNDVIINKVQSIQRCILRAKEEYEQAGDTFRDDYTRQDASILNLTRACEQSIDLANHIIKTHKLGIPTRSSDSFSLLIENKIINKELGEKLIKMTGFRNTAIHQYQELNIGIVIAIITTGISDLLAFSDRCLEMIETG